MLTRFALERLLFWLGRSRYADRFMFKGAMLLMSWFEDPHRGTRDLDPLGCGDPNPEAMLATFRGILAGASTTAWLSDADALEQALYDRRPLQDEGLIHHRDRGVQGGFKRSSQHSDVGGCDEHSKSAISTVWTSSIAIARTAACGGAR